MPYPQAKAALLKLQPADRTWVNGVPVMRVPCAGCWFDVVVRWNDMSAMSMGSDGTVSQMLKLPDAAARCASGYVERLVWR
jgi:hypothetical protein